MRRLSDDDSEVSGTDYLTHEFLRQVVDYDPATGDFTWKPREHAAKEWNSRHAGKRAGARNGVTGYRRLCVGTRYYYSHRLAWFYMYGVWPVGEVDHINGVRDDNRIANLRAVTGQENRRNQSLGQANTSGVIGVTFNRRRGKWIAQVGIHGRMHHLGCFVHKDDAIAARQAANERLGFHPNHGRAA